MPIPVAARSKAWVRGPSLAGIGGSNPASSMDVCLLCVLCCQRSLKTGRSLTQKNATERGVSECDLETSTMRRLRPSHEKKTSPCSIISVYFRHDRCWQLALPKLVKELPAFLEPKSSLLLFTTARHYTVLEPCVSPLHLHIHCSLTFSRLMTYMCVCVSYRTANLQMLHFIYLFNKYTYWIF